MKALLSETKSFKGFFIQFGPLALPEIYQLQNSPILLILGYKIRKKLEESTIKRYLAIQSPIIKEFKLRSKQEKGYRIRYGLSSNPFFSQMNQNLVMSSIVKKSKCSECDTQLVTVGEEQKHTIPMFCNEQDQDSQRIQIIAKDHKNAFIYYKKGICGIINLYSGRISLLGKDKTSEEPIEYFLAYKKSLDHKIIKKYEALKILVKEELY